ncbi:hypothetical protein BDV93DRAFT_220924 [Ceratobasidium sp. AG-I]|nr:hypothetical protein BDV93DRAFT_220924 [Ceratobasidium sp. AG-I]
MRYVTCFRNARDLSIFLHGRHPNVAVAVGVTRGYDGLNGFVVATDGIPLIKALEISVAGGFLARCLKGLTQALAFFREQEYSVGLDYRGDGVTVAPDGHITVLMFKTSLSTTNSIRPDWARDPTANILLRMYYRATLEYAQGDHPKAEQMSRILGFLTTLGRSHLTELQLLNMAVDCGLDPFDSNHWWDNTVTPPSTIHCGDLVRIANHHPEGVDWRVLGEGWEVLEECNNAAEGLDIGCRWGLACYQDCGWERLLRIRAGYRTWVTSCHHVSIMSPQVHTNNKPNWKNVMERAMKLSKQHKINLRHISYVTSTKMSITAERLKSSIHPASEAVLYFHRNPFSRSSLRVFYGFFSASRDPCAPSMGLKDTEWRFTHRIEYNVKCIGDDWKLQYQRALESGLATIPGAYPGASVQELSNDETE